MTSTNRVVANALISLEELLKKQGLSRAEFDKMMKEMKDKGASAVHYMRGKDGRLLFKADGTTIGNAISEKAVNGEEVENTRTLPVSKQAWTECELKGIEAMKKYLASHKGVLPRTIKEVDDVLGIIPDIDVAEKQNVMSYFKYGRGKSLVANSMKDDVAKIAKMVGRSLTPNEERSARILLEAGEPASRIARSIQATATNAATNAKFKVGDKVQRGNQIGVVKDIEKEPYIEVKFKDEPITLFVHERELKISNSRATNAKFKVGDKVRIIGGGVETITKVYPKGHGTGLGPQEVDFYATRESGGFITDEDISGVVSSSARNAITGRLPNGMQANDAAAELDRYANKLVQESDKYSFGKHSRRGVSALVDRRTGAVIEIRVHVQTGGAYSQMKDKIDSELKAIGRKFGATDTNTHYWKGDTELTLKFPTTNSRACNASGIDPKKMIAYIKKIVSSINLKAFTGAHGPEIRYNGIPWEYGVALNPYNPEEVVVSAHTWKDAPKDDIKDMEEKVKRDTAKLVSKLNASGFSATPRFYSQTKVPIYLLGEISAQHKGQNSVQPESARAHNAAGYVDASSVVLHPGDAVVFKAQYSSHKDDDEWLERNGDTVREVRGNEVKLGPSANDWAKKSDLMVWHNAARSRNDALGRYKPGARVAVELRTRPIVGKVMQYGGRPEVEYSPTTRTRFTGTLIKQNGDKWDIKSDSGEVYKSVSEADFGLSYNSRSSNSVVQKALNARAKNGTIGDLATVKRDIEQSLRKMADFATKFTGAKTTPSSALDDPMYSGYIELTFPTEEESANFNPYYLINKLGDDKSLLPRWAWGIYGFNYNRNGRTWRIKIGRFAT